jgi:hypothetical protein
MARPYRYAEGTDVSPEKSRADLEAVLRKNGAQEFNFYAGPERDIFTYRIQGWLVRHVLERPKPATLQSKKPGAPTLKPEQLKRLADKEWRRRWRALLLVVKAKLEIVANGDSSVPREFMADLLLANGETMRDVMLPRLEAMYSSGEMPSLMLGPGSS